MADLTTTERKKLPAKDFAGPNRSYPVENKAHARDAKARASEQEHKGHISKSEERRIDSKADRVLSGSRAVQHLHKHHNATHPALKRPR